MDNTREDLNHAVLQKLIIVMLGMMTVAVFMQSCTYGSSCAAYNQVEVEQQDK